MTTVGEGRISLKRGSSSRPLPSGSPISSKDQVGFFALGKREPSFSGIGFQDDMSFSQEPAQCGTEGRFVVNNQNLVFFAH